MSAFFSHSTPYLSALWAGKDRQIAKLQAWVTQLGVRIVQLEPLLEKATRARKRQVVPFSEGTPKPAPKMPGRKPGERYGPKAPRPFSEPAEEA